MIFQFILYMYRIQKVNKKCKENDGNLENHPTVVRTYFAVMSTNAEPTSSGIVFVDDLNVRHEPLNADEVRRILKTYHGTIIIVIINITKQ